VFVAPSKVAEAAVCGYAPPDKKVKGIYAFVTVKNRVEKGPKTGRKNWSHGCGKQIPVRWLSPESIQFRGWFAEDQKRKLMRRILTKNFCQAMSGISAISAHWLTRP